MIADLSDSLQNALEVLGGELFAALIVVTALAVATIVGFIGWIIGVQRSSAEIAALKSQIITNEGQILQSAQQARSHFDGCAIRCGVIAKEIIDAVKGQAPNAVLDSAREALAACLLNETIPAFLCKVEWAGMHLKSMRVSPDRYVELLDDTIDELRRFKSWLQVINHQKLLTELRRSPQHIQARTLRPLLLAVEQFPDHVRNTQMRRASVVIKELTT
jgi:hypothetical protein